MISVNQIGISFFRSSTTTRKASGVKIPDLKNKGRARKGKMIIPSVFIMILTGWNFSLPAVCSCVNCATKCELKNILPLSVKFGSLFEPDISSLTMNKGKSGFSINNSM